MSPASVQRASSVQQASALRPSGMRSGRRIIAVLLIAVVAAGFAIPSTAAQAKICQAPAGRYEVTPPRAGPTAGADPAEVAAANCGLGFREDTAYPLSVIALCLLFTAATLALLRRGTSYEPIASEG